MASVRDGRHTADLDAVTGDEVVVFLIGMRVNRPWKVASWWPVFTAMPRMLRYLEQRPEKGLLGLPPGVPPLPDGRAVLALVRRPRALRPGPERPAPGALAPFNRRVADNGDVGIWHETYRVRTA